MEVRLATVCEVKNDGQATVIFYGENVPSGKQYSYIRNFMPQKDDTVALVRFGETYVIIGAVVKGPILPQYAKNDHNHDNTYSKTDHTHGNLKNERYAVELVDEALIPSENVKVSLGKSGAVYIEIYGNDIHALARFIVGDREITQTSIGSSAKKFTDGYFEKVHIGGASITEEFLEELKTPSVVKSNTLSRKITFTGAELVPDTTGVLSIGNSSRRFKDGHFVTLYVDGVEVTQELFDELRKPTGMKSSTTTREISFAGSVLLPDVSNAVSLGSSIRQYKEGYFTNLYLDGSAVSTSDRRKKKFIKKLPNKFEQFFLKLRPVTFKYKKGTSGRTHVGFVAQEVEQAMTDAGISREEFGGLVIQENGQYGLRYEEFIAIQTRMIQSLYQRVEELERKVEDFEKRN